MENELKKAYEMLQKIIIIWPLFQNQISFQVKQ